MKEPKYKINDLVIYFYGELNEKHRVLPNGYHQGVIQNARQENGKEWEYWVNAYHWVREVDIKKKL